MKKNQMTTSMILGLLIFLPIFGFFTIGGICASPSYVGIYEEDEYAWDFNIYLSDWSQWDADNMTYWLTTFFAHDLGSNLTKIYYDWSWDATPPQSIWPIDIETIFPETTGQILLSMGITDLITYTAVNGTTGYEMPDWPMGNTYYPWAQNIVSNTSSFAKQSLYGGMATSPYWIMGLHFAPNNVNWTEFAAECQAGIGVYWGPWAGNSTIAAQSNGYLITMPAYGLAYNTEIIQITVTYNSDGILTYYSFEYGANMLCDYVLTKAISGTLTITSPTSSDTWDGGSSYYINWTSTGVIEDVKLELYMNDAFVMQISPNTTNDGEFLWSIPSSLADSTEYQIKITELADSTTFDFSEYFEIYTPVDHLTIVTPNNSTAWEINTTNTIVWKSPTGVPKVNLDLYYNDTLKTAIATNIVNKEYNEFEWTIPSYFNASSLYQIRVTQWTNGTNYDYSDYFEIYHPTITVTAPDSATAWPSGVARFITWTTRGTTIEYVNIELYLNNVKISTITTNITNDGDFAWVIPETLSDSSLYQIKIIDADNSSYYDYSDYFEIYTPIFIIITPDSTTSWEAGTTLNIITWASNGTSSSVQIELYLSDVFIGYVTGLTLNDGQFEWEIPGNLTASTEYQIKILDYNDPDTFAFSDYFEITPYTGDGQPGGSIPPVPWEPYVITISIVAGVAVAAAGAFLYLKRKRVAG